MSLRVALVHVGSFSGCARALRAALSAHAEVEDWDLLPLARRPGMAWARLRATLEARRAGRGIPWTRTRAWCEALQRAVLLTGLGRAQPVLFAQTLPAFTLGGSVPYAVYTDRVAREGASSPPPWHSRFTPDWLACEEAFLRGASRIYVMGPSTVGVLEREYGVEPGRVAVVGAGPNVVLTPPCSSSVCRTLLFVGRQWEPKGGPELLAAFSSIRPEFPDLRLVLAGCDPRSRLPDGVCSVGRVPPDAMDALYSRADALVHPSHREAVGMVLIEAMCKGLPCIGTAVGNQRWVIGEAGLIVEPGRVDTLADALRTLIRNYPEFRRRAMVRARHVRVAFRWEAVAATIAADLGSGVWGTVECRTEGPVLGYRSRIAVGETPTDNAYHKDPQ